MTTTLVMGVNYLSLGNVDVSDIDGERRYELLLSQESGRPAAAFALPLGSLILLPAEAVFMQPDCVCAAEREQAYRLTMNELMGMIVHRRHTPHFRKETPAQVIERTVTPLFNTGVLNVAFFIHSLQYLSPVTLKTAPGLRESLELTRKYWPSWQLTKNVGHMLPILVKRLEEAFTH